MNDLARGFKGLNLGLRTGLSIESAEENERLRRERLTFDKQRYEEGKLLSDLQVKVADRKAQAELMKSQNDRMKMGYDFAKMFITPEEGVTKKQMDNFVQGARSQFGIDFSSVFQPVTDEKTGNPIGYKLETEETFKKRIDDQNADADRQIESAKLANEKIKTSLMEKGIFDNAEQIVTHHLSKDPELAELSPEDQISKIAKSLDQFKGPASTHTPKFAKGGTELEIEKKLTSLTETAFAVDRIADVYQEQFLTWPGKAKRISLNAAAKIAGKKGEKWLREKVYKDENEQFLGQAWEFKSELGRNFDAYRHEVTGAQAAVKELKILEERVLNSKMSSPEFEYALGKYSHRVKRQIRIQRLLLAEGFKGDAFWKEFNRQVTLPGDDTIKPGNIKTRGDQLKELYSTKFSGRDLQMEINKQLRREGWLK